MRKTYSLNFHINLHSVYATSLSHYHSLSITFSSFQCRSTCRTSDKAFNFLARSHLHLSHTCALSREWVSEWAFVWWLGPAPSNPTHAPSVRFCVGWRAYTFVNGCSCHTLCQYRGPNSTRIDLSAAGVCGWRASCVCLATCDVWSVFKNRRSQQQNVPWTTFYLVVVVAAAIFDFVFIFAFDFGYGAFEFVFGCSFECGNSFFSVLKSARWFTTSV